MSQTPTPTQTDPATSSEICTCEHPIRVHRAERKGAAITVCARCGLRVPARLR
jgi:hypothetical protein